MSDVSSAKLNSASSCLETDLSNQSSQIILWRIIYYSSYTTWQFWVTTHTMLPFCHKWSFKTVAELLGCSIEDLNLALSKRHMKVNNENIVQKLTLAQATDTRDALAKSVYASLFEWLVQQINKSLSVGKRRTGRSISILDICGFESFDKNSFEQFCINYDNERLQQHFSGHLFKLEQEEYVEDGIDWAKFEFEDNQDCLNLFEKL
ncbi:hypothetical protein BS78_06G276000 [Paspalum vaginatum]|nr:hypothetical protein BS78_06G276000 [Paspalum vaginatum]